MVRVSRAFLLSVVVHGGVYAVAAGVRAPDLTRPSLPAVVDFEVAEPEPKPDPPAELVEPVLERDPEPALPTPPPPTLASQPRAAIPEPESPATAPAPIDLTGVTLTNTSGDGAFAVEAGNGQSSSGPIVVRPIADRRSPRAVRDVAPSARTAPAAPPIVVLSNLSQRPVPPNLDAALRRHYPQNARRLGLEGEAVVRARIGPTGRLDRVRVVSSSEPEFGVACERTLQGTRWSAPLDASGRPVHTEVTYVCRFRVDG